MKIKIALVGNPNCGKTTLFNELTGNSQYIGNWPGVTVERKEGVLKGHKDVIIQDLPGIYSLSPYSQEEVIARDYLLNDQPDAILNIIDATNLERNLYLTTQLLELGIPMVVAVNMTDVLDKCGEKIDTDKLSAAIGCKVIAISALKNKNLKESAELAIDVAQKKIVQALPQMYSGEVRNVIDSVALLLAPYTPKNSIIYISSKFFEGDEDATKNVSLPPHIFAQISDMIKKAEQKADDDGASIITSARYNFIQNIVEAVYKSSSKNSSGTLSDKIDAVVTNKYLAFPIFVAVMFCVYFISITTAGAFLTDFTNDTIFGEWILPAAEGALRYFGIADWLTGLTVDGIIGGVGAVLGFVPQMLLLFFLLAILEDCGYMARVAFIMDRIFRRFGLSGKSFIPMLIGSGCGVPGIMASRTIENERDRRITIITTTFIPCGAKMPIVALIAGALFNGSWWVAPSAYFIGMGAVIISGLILKKFSAFAGKPAPFIMEMPPYHVPVLINLVMRAWERGWSFIKRAGTIILLASVMIWVFSNIGIKDGSLAMVEDMNTSVLAAIGSFFAPLFAPLGFGTWESTVATIMGLVAKEEVVGAFGVLYGIQGDALAFVDAGDFGALNNIAAHFTALSAFSFLIFNLLFAPCFAAIGAIKREMMSTKWTLFALLYLTIFAYSIAFIVYQLGLWITGGGFGFGAAIACLLILIMAYLIFRKPHSGDDYYRKVKVEVKEECCNG